MAECLSLSDYRFPLLGRSGIDIGAPTMTFVGQRSLLGLTPPPWVPAPRSPPCVDHHLPVPPLPATCATASRRKLFVGIGQRRSGAARLSVGDHH